MKEHEKKALSKCVDSLDSISASLEFADKSNPTRGKCYIASRALLEFLGGKSNGYSLMCAKDLFDVPHYWVASGEGVILDPTIAQYKALNITPPYEHGKSVGYRPMKKHMILLNAMRQE